MKIIKWILCLLAGIAGVVAMFGGQSKKEIKKKIKQNKKKINKKTEEIKKIKTGKAAIKETIKSKQKAIDEMKKAKKEYKPKDVGAKDAADFLKKYAKKKKGKK